MRRGTLRLPVVLLLLGFLGVAAGTIALVVAYVGLSSGSRLVEFFAPVVAYGLVGLAWWLWTPAARTGPTGATAMRRSSRVLAVAAAVTAIGFLANFYLNYQFIHNVPGGYVPRRFELELASQASEALGMLLAAAGFWIASYSTAPTDQLVPAPDPSLAVP
jgi:hypothetical protein